MDPELRGRIEQNIDLELTGDRLEKNFRILKYFKDNGIIDSVESGIFGCILESVFDDIIYYLMRRGLELSSEDADEFKQSMDSRAMQIKARIREIASR